MEKNGLPLWAMLDSGLTWILRTALAALAPIGLLALGVAAVMITHHIIFEYDDGASDLSIMEWGFLGLSVVLMARLEYYIRHFGHAWWSALLRPLHALGLLSAVWLGIAGGWLFLGLWLSGEDLQASMRHSSASFPLSRETIELGAEALWLGSVLIALYLAAPLNYAKAVIHGDSTPSTTTAGWPQPAKDDIKEDRL